MIYIGTIHLMVHSSLCIQCPGADNMLLGRFLSVQRSYYLLHSAIRYKQKQDSDTSGVAVITLSCSVLVLPLIPQFITADRAPLTHHPTPPPTQLVSLPPQQIVVYIL